MERQQLFDVMIAGFAGTMTSLLLKIKNGKLLTIKGIAIEIGLAVCAVFAARIACSAWHVDPDTAQLVYFATAWLGSKAASTVEANVDRGAERLLNKWIDRL